MPLRAVRRRLVEERLQAPVDVSTLPRAHGRQRPLGPDHRHHAGRRVRRWRVEDFVVVDPETVEGADLARTAYEAHQIGLAKCDAVAELAERIKPCVRITPIQATIAELGNNLFGLCNDIDIVVAATDDPAGQAPLSHHAYWASRPLISCALYRHAAAGEVVMCVPEIATSCWSCTIGGGSHAGRVRQRRRRRRPFAAEGRELSD